MLSQRAPAWKGACIVREVALQAADAFIPRNITMHTLYIDDMGSLPESSVANDPHDPPLVSPVAANSPEATETEQPDVIRV